MICDFAEAKSKGEPTPTEKTSAEAAAAESTDKSKDERSTSKTAKEKKTKEGQLKPEKQKEEKPKEEKPKEEKPAKEKSKKSKDEKSKKSKDEKSKNGSTTNDTKADSKTDGSKPESSKPDPERTADAVLKRLQAGNQRYMSGRSIHSRFDAQRRMETAEQGQKPYATVLGCSDARVPPEVVFDQGFADIFVIRVAGNVCGESELASAEYGTKYLGTQLLVVLGHSKCGAVDATVKGAELEGSLPKLVAMIEPAVEKTKREHPSLKDEALLNESIENNVRQTIDQVVKGSSVLRELVSSNKLKVVGAVRDITTGKIHWIK